MKKRFNYLFNQWAIVFLFCIFATIGYSQKTISGVLTDASSAPLIGATVMVPGTSTGTITDIDGSFSLSVPNDATELKVSYTGFESMMLDISNQTTFSSIALNESSALLDEVVVIGYGRQKKSVVTGAVSSLDVQEIASRGPGQIQSNIQGKVAGVTITPTSGAPDAGFKVKIRGTGSNGPTEPLYIVDGMRTRDIRFLEGSAIKSLEILKDAASASIYGAEGANGVVLISTKNGEKAEGLTYNGQYGVQSYRGNMELMNAEQWKGYLVDAGVASADSLINTSTSTNWLDELFVNAPTTRHNLSFAGGSDKTSYYVGAGFFDQAGIVGGPDVSNFRRLSANLGLHSEVNSRVDVDANFSFANEKSRGGGFGDANVGGIIASAILMDPTSPRVYTGALPDFVNNLNTGGTQLAADADGNPYGLSQVVTGEIINPYIYLNTINGDGNNANRMFGSVSAKVNILDGLDFTTRVGGDLTNGTFHNWSPSYYANPTRQSTEANSAFSSYNTAGIQLENFLTYGIDLGSNMNLDLLGGTAIFQSTTSFLNANASGLVSEIQEVSYIDGSESNSQVRGGRESERLQSYFGRANLNISDKYLLMASLRRDGTSLFSQENRWKTYPGLSAGWVVSREGFFNNDGLVNFMKVRASWGQAGSLSGSSPGAGLSTINFLYRYSDANGNFTTAGDPNTLPNPDLTWETSEQTNVGIDLGLFSDRLTFSADWFNKLTRDLLTPGAPPGFIGNNAPLINAGTMRNTGFEFELGYNNRDGELKYQAAVNLTTLQNEVTELNGANDILQGTNSSVGTDWNPSAFEEGRPAWYYRGYQTDGLNDDGTPNIVDTNEDGAITPDDFTYIGDPHANLIYGATINLEYKGFDFTVFGQGQAGNQILMGFNRQDRGEGNKPTVFLEDDFFAPSLSGNGYTSDFMVFEGAFFRMKQIQLGYDAGDIINGAEDLRVYLSVEDFFTVTDYPGLDPEIGSNFDSAIGIDRGVYPIPGRILVGASLNF